MNHKELKKILRNEGIGNWYGGIRLFDGEYAYPTRFDMLQRVNWAVKTLAELGYVPSTDYAEFGADCDSSSKWLQAVVNFKWYLENKGLKSFPAYPFGTAILPGHAINLGVTQEGIIYFDYGQVMPRPDKITEVEIY